MSTAAHKTPPAAKPPMVGVLHRDGFPVPRWKALLEANAS